MAKLILQKELAALAGVSGPAISKMTRPGKRLHKAVAGKYIDLYHPATIEYLELRKKAVETLNQKRAENPQAQTYHQPPALPPTVVLNPDQTTSVRVGAKTGKAAIAEHKKNDDFEIRGELPENIREFGDMTLRKILYMFGTDVRFTDWLKASKTIEDIHTKRVKTAEIEGELIPRSLVSNSVFTALDELFKRLLTDGAKAIAVRAIDSHTSGEAMEVVEETVQKIITSHIKPVKQKIIESLKNA